MKRKIYNSFGFTIVEVMIVLAIAALIMMIVLVAAPALQASRRDAERKSYVGRLLDSEEEYLKNNTVFPACDTAVRAGCDPSRAAHFITSYMPDGDDPETGKPYNSQSTTQGSNGNGSYVKTTNNTTFYYYDAANVNHHMTPPAGEIYIAVGHYCVGHGPSSPNASDDGPLAGPDTDFSRIVILIGLEKGGYYCIDNNSSS